MCLFGAWRRKAPTALSVELASHTRLLAAIAKDANCLLFALVLIFPFTQKTALSSLMSYFSSLVFYVCGPCERSTSDCAVLLRSRRTKRSGIMRKMSLLCVCRKERSDGIAIATKSIASCVPPRGAVPWVPSNEVQRGNGIWVRRVKQHIR